jgi:predicted nucleic acid-binding protein
LTSRHVVVDANVFVSFLIERNEQQRVAARELFESAGDGKITAIVTQFAIFEVAYVLQSFYGIAIPKVATLVREMVAMPGLIVIDDCPWRKVFEYWPERVTGMADAATIAVSVTNHYDAIATFDHDMVKRMRNLKIDSYW